MASNQDETAVIENKLEKIIADFLQQAFLGLQPDRQLLLSSNPELHDELLAFFEHHDC